MSWIKKVSPQIPGYENLGDNVEAKRWLQFDIRQLLDTGDPLWEYRALLKTREQVCNFVISQFDYPMRAGLPTDKHYNNWFDSNCCHTISQDYWQCASETLRTLRLNQRENEKGIGDCEDVSVLFTTLFLMKRWQAWECLGYLLRDGAVLGGHGWSIFRDKGGSWRLYEATLSTPPGGYPLIDPEATAWKVGNTTYEGLVKFNRHEYYESEEGNLMDRYLGLKVKDKETRAKHEAISEAWRTKTKPLARVGLLERLRWRM